MLARDAGWRSGIADLGASLEGRRLDRRIEDWRAAGIVDDATAARIRAFEVGRPGLRLSAVLAILGAFAIALGLAALVAANWQELPVWLKLGGHGVLNAGLGLAAWIWLERDRHGGGTRLRTEAALLLLSVSTLAFVAHVGQSFQLQGGLTGLLGAWLLLTLPFTLAAVRSAFHMALWSLGLLVFGVSLTADQADRLAAADRLATALVLAVAALHAARGLRLPGRWAGLPGPLALGVGLVLVCAGTVFWRLSPDGLVLTPADALTGAVVGALALPLAHRAGRRGDGPGTPPLLPVMLALAPAWGLLPHLLPHGPWPAAEALAFCLTGLAVAKLALDGRQLWLFNLAVAAVALRLFLVFLEAAGGLTATGLGLIAGGVLLLGLGWAAQRAMAWAARHAAAPPTGG